MSISKVAVALGVIIGFVRMVEAGPPGPALVWDSELKEIHPATNQSVARVSFSVTNVSRSEVVIQEVRPSCGCTLVSLPAKPWKLSPGATGTVTAEIDLALKSGWVVNTLSVITSIGSMDLVFKVHLPERPTGGSTLAERVRRLRAQQMPLLTEPPASATSNHGSSTSDSFPVHLSEPRIVKQADQ